jgi:hypothetical protein
MPTPQASGPPRSQSKASGPAPSSRTSEGVPLKLALAKYSPRQRFEATAAWQLSDWTVSVAAFEVVLSHPAVTTLR